MATESIVLDKRFKVGRVLGRGPSGIVHLATDLSRGSECVVKRIYAKYANRSILDRVQAVSHAASDMMHPAVLGVLYTGYEPSGALYLVSPLVQGESLRARLQRGPLSLTATLSVLEPLCSVLQAAAERELAHGSLTPSNILLPEDGGVMLSDFGMAQLRTTPGVKWEGQLGYAAPESLEVGASPATQRGDVFGLGAIVYECLIGQPMFDAKTLAAYLAMVGTPPKLTVRHPSYAHIDAVLEMAAAADPEARFSTVQALWRALQSALLDLPASLANNLTRGMSPSPQRNVTSSRPPLPAKSSASKPPQLPHRSEHSAPPAPLHRQEPSNPPPAPRNVQEMPTLLIEEEIEALGPPGPPQQAKPQPRPAPAGGTLKLPTSLPPPPELHRGPSVRAEELPAAPAGPTMPFAKVVAAPAPVASVTAPTPVTVAPAAPAPVTAAPAPRAQHRPVAAMPPVRPPAAAGPAELRAPGAPRPNRPDPQQILPTDPSYRLRPPPPSRFAALAPLFWATVGGVVVGGSMIGVQYLSRTPIGSSHSSTAARNVDIDALLRQAESELMQRSYGSAFAYAELILRVQPQHSQAKLIAEQASEQLRVSAVYGAFLRAADREQADVAVALYRELPPGSPFRTQAWDPFMNVRNSFVRSRLAVATAALSAAQCEQIREQIEKLYFISDSVTDSALQQGQRLLGKCKSEHAEDPVLPREEKAEKAEKADKPARAEKADKPARTEKAERSEKPELVADAGESAKPKKRKSKPDKGGTDKPAVASEPKEEPKAALPGALRNPF
jgi:serine/threonine protein kinase